MITVVTAFVPIPDHPRSEAEYRELAAPLLAQTDKIPLLCAEGELEGCWLYRYLTEDYDGKLTHSVSDNPRKNSLAYHCVQAQKFDFLLAAAEIDYLADVFVWLDYGILHVPGVTMDVINKFLKRVDNERAIAIPGCWDKGLVAFDDEHPCWRFCGGLMVVPRKYLHPLSVAMKREYLTGLEQTGNISWEVNVLARVELTTNLPIWWYQADHDQTMFTNYRATEFADGQRGPRLVAHHESDQRFI